MPPDALAEFQAALLELLAAGLPVELTRERLNDDPAFAAFRDYAASFEGRMLEVAVELVREWGRRAP